MCYTLYIYDSSIPLGSASKWWLNKSLKSLNKSLKDNLVVLIGNLDTILPKLIKDYKITEIIYNERYSLDEINQDEIIQNIAKNHNIKLLSFHSCL